MKRPLFIFRCITCLTPLLLASLGNAQTFESPETPEIGEVTGFYLSGFMGASTPIDETLYSPSSDFLPSISTDNTGIAGIAFGISIAPNFRLEGEINHQRLLSKAQDAIQSAGTPTNTNLNLFVKSDVSRLMFNGYYDLHLTPYCALFLMGGIGASLIDSGDWRWQNIDTGTQTITQGASSSKFAWQMGFGQSFFWGRTVAIDIGTRFVNAGSVKSETESNADIPELGTELKTFDFSTQEWLIGVRIRF